MTIRSPHTIREPWGEKKRRTYSDVWMGKLGLEADIRENPFRKYKSHTWYKGMIIVRKPTLRHISGCSSDV